MKLHLSIKMLCFYAFITSYTLIRTAVESGKSSLTVFSYNICTEARTFDTPLDLKHRLPTIERLIDSHRPDIVCLQEVRSKCAASVVSLLDKLGYTTHYAANNDTPMSLGLITAHKPTLRTVEEPSTKWFSETPDVSSENPWYKFGRIYTLTKFCTSLSSGSADSTEKPLFILNTHLGLAEEEKEYSAHQLVNAVSDKDQLLLVGDFNFFSDKRAHIQQEIYLDAGLTDALASTTSGSFVGYSYDTFIPKTKAELAKLDGVFSKGIDAQATILLYDQLKEDLSNRDEQPSDHLPIFIEVKTR